MRVDASQILAQGGVKTKQGTEALLDSLKEGANGLGAGGEDGEEDLSVVKPHLMRGFSDKSLAPFASKLAELHMPVKEDTARAMRDLMAQNPKLSMDEAAFLASNKITGDESLMRAALSVLSGGDKTSAMIAKILSTLGEQDFLVNKDLGTRDPENSISGSKLPENFHVSDSGRAPLSELIAAVVKLTPGLLAASEGAAGSTSGVANQGAEQMPGQASNQAGNQAGTTPSQISQPIISQSVDILQSNAEKIVENLQKPVFDGAAGSGDAKVVQVAVQAGDQIGSPLQGDAKVAQAAGEEGKPAQVTARADEILRSAQNEKGDGKSVQNTVAQLLSEIPEFKGTPQMALDRFSNMLLRIAQDTGAAESGAAKDVEMLASQLEKMFTKIDRNDADAGKRLHQAREELFARLTLVQEEIARASQPMREALLSQTQKLMDHVKLLNNIEQFAYLQLPVQLAEERTTAELYVFKRKGGKRADPDNVNILLSIDLEFMGHWEALLNIKGKDVVLDMEVAGEAEKEHFGENTVLLHELLSEDGFKLVNTTIKISQEETTPLTALSAFDRYKGGRLGKIDFMI